MTPDEERHALRITLDAVVAEVERIYIDAAIHEMPRHALARRLYDLAQFMRQAAVPRETR